MPEPEAVATGFFLEIMRLRHVYLLLFVIGTLLPLALFWPWFEANSLNLRLFFSELFSTSIGAFFGADVMISAVVLLIFAAAESRRVKMDNQVIVVGFVVIATMCAGVSSGFPLFLFLRQRHLDGIGKAEEAL
jgi:Terpene cyclase DEP1